MRMLMDLFLEDRRAAGCVLAAGWITRKRYWNYFMNRLGCDLAGWLYAGLWCWNFIDSAS
jgi:hypothetical protein